MYKNKTQSIFKHYFFSTKPFWKYIYMAFFMMLIIVAVAMTLPRLFKIIIDDYIPQRNFNTLLYSCVFLMGLYVIRMGAMILRNNRMLHFGYHYIYDLRTKLMHHFQLLSFRYYDRATTGDIMNRMLDDVMNTEFMTTNSLIYLLEDVIIITAVTIIILCLNFKLGLLAIAVIPVYAIIHNKCQRKMKVMNKSIRDNYSQLATEFHDSIAGVKIIRAFNLEEHKKNQFQKYVAEDRKLRIKTYTFNAFFMSLTEYITILGILLVLIGGGYYAIVKQTMTSGTIVAFYTYLSYLYQPIIRLSSTTAVIETGMSSIKRIYEILDTNPSPPEKLDPIIPHNRSQGRVIFDNISFFYDGSHKPSLTNLSFDIEPGKCIALVGPSGAGKSTVVNLLTRFYDPTSGSIYLDNINLCELQFKWLRENIALVLQEGFLFWGTIRENIRYGNINASDNDVEQAARLANAYDFIVQFPKGFDTPLGERGVGLSGGQKQRIAIARAILKNAPILILAEATSALDNESEFKMQQAFKELVKHRTTFIIAHRLSTIQSADEIFVMDKGQLIERGTHQICSAKKVYTLNCTIQISSIF